MTGGAGTEDRLSARRIHKADREKLRRDKLNEQFSELASALDPDRPKNDKATILGESVQILKDLREEVKRLKTEHTSLLNESHDLTQEKNELREEKAALKSETDQLQSQIQQRLRALPPWMALDPMAMGAAAFPYPMPVPQSVSLPPSDSQVGPPCALMAPSPYMPMSPFHTHPSLQTYAMFGNRAGEGGNSYMPFPGFPQPVNSQTHIERPYAQYPSPLQPVPGYVVQMPANQVSQSQQMSSSSTPPIYRPFVAGIPVASPQSHSSNQRSEGGGHRLLTSHSSSQPISAESEQDSAGVVGPECSVEAPATQAHEQPQISREGASRDLQQNDSCGQDAEKSFTCLVKSEEAVALSRDHHSPTVVVESCKILGTEPSFNSHLEVEPEHINDPTLRPPAA